MQKVFIILLLSLVELFSFELVVIGDKNFPESNLTRSEIKAIFLDKKRFINDKKILVMNHKVNHYVRLCFEKTVLEKQARSLERYWRKAYYQGKHPPKIVSSTNMLLLYLDSITPAIGYSDINDINTTVDKEVSILYRSECETEDD